LDAAKIMERKRYVSRKETKRSKPYYLSDIVSAVLGTPAGELDLDEQPALLAREQRQ
jgi:hypothetical protein